MQLGPSSSLARLQYANYLTAVGRSEEPIAIGTRTVELDPLLPLAHQELGLVYHAAGRYDEALGHRRAWSWIRRSGPLTSFGPFYICG